MSMGNVNIESFVKIFNILKGTVNIMENIAASKNHSNIKIKENNSSIITAFPTAPAKKKHGFPSRSFVFGRIFVEHKGGSIPQRSLAKLSPRNRIGRGASGVSLMDFFFRGRG